VVEWGNIVSIGLEVVGLIETTVVVEPEWTRQLQFWRDGRWTRRIYLQ